MTTAPDDLNFEDLDDLIASFAEVGIAATDDERDVKLPGVWIRFDGIPPSPLAACVMRLTVFAVVQSSTSRRQTKADLQALWNKVRPVLEEYGGPSGLVANTALILPVSQTPMPALSAPLDLVTTQEGDNP